MLWIIAWTLFRANHQKTSVNVERTFEFRCGFNEKPRHFRLQSCNLHEHEHSYRPSLKNSISHLTYSLKSHFSLVLPEKLDHRIATIKAKNRLSKPTLPTSWEKPRHFKLQFCKFAWNMNTAMVALSSTQFCIRQTPPRATSHLFRQKNFDQPIAMINAQTRLSDLTIDIPRAAQHARTIDQRHHRPTFSEPRFDNIDLINSPPNPNHAPNSNPRI